MNPENIGAHVDMRHSSLWRKSMFNEKHVPEQDVCHRRLNQLGETGQQWRTRNNMIHTTFSHLRNKSMLPQHNKSLVSHLLKDSSYKDNTTKSMLSELTVNAEVLQRSQKLVEGMAKLKEMNLLQAKDLQRVKFPGVLKHHHIYNDYHTSKTNQGFSRNFQGKFYTK